MMAYTKLLLRVENVDLNMLVSKIIPMITNGNTQQIAKSSPEKPFSNTASEGLSGLTYTVTPPRRILLSASSDQESQEFLGCAYYIPCKSYYQVY